jgi:flagellar biosynthesis/type III secretory pathway protein FliH
MENENITPESNHPVLQQLKDKIAELEASATKQSEMITYWREKFWKLEANTKEALTEAWDNDYDKDTITYIAEQLDISLSTRKQYEINITYTIDVEVELGSEIDPEWDFDFSVSHSDLVDYSTDIIYANEVS